MPLSLFVCVFVFACTRHNKYAALVIASGDLDKRVAIVSGRGRYVSVRTRSRCENSADEKRTAPLRKTTMDFVTLYFCVQQGGGRERNYSP